MLQNPKANTFLYVPFNHEYSVSPRLQELLTKEEFFKECYYEPDFDKAIKEIKSLVNEGSYSLSYPMDPQEMIENLKSQKKSRQQFLDWIDNNDVGIYCITGDAGTGKSTFLHNLAYKNQGNSIWNFLDLQSAHTPINLMNYRIRFKNFQYLQQKLCSTIIAEIIKKLFIKNKTFQYDYTSTKKIIDNLLSAYFSEIDILYPRDEIRCLFNDLINIDKSLSDKEFCESCAKILFSFFDSLSQDYLDKNETSGTLMELYLIILKINNSDKKNIIVFDNLERFIGVDEIYNDQIYVFLTKLREIFDNYEQDYHGDVENESLFSKHFQFIVAMRHTTTRMFIPQQNSDFIEHMSNLSEWFSIDEIIKLKINWLDNHGFNSSDNDMLLNILSDKGICGNTIRGLRLKLNALFNNNKRLILDFLISVLEDDKYSDMLLAAKTFYNNKTLPERLSKYAYRSIIWKIVIDKLLGDELFNTYISNYKNFDYFTSIDYMRKILIILSNYSLDHKYGYMNLEELLRKLYPKKYDVSTWFYSNGCVDECKQIFTLLYFMNYYCRRDNNWFQFIDIQCNSNVLSGVHIKDPDDFYDIIRKNNIAPSEINIQITTSGRAYLGYIAHTFEFISSINGNDSHLLLSIPTEKEIIEKQPDEIECVKLITNVLNKSKTICDKIDADIPRGYDVLYKKNSHAQLLPYSDSIKKSHWGYIDLFCDYLMKTYNNKDNRNLVAGNKKLIKKIQDLRSSLG